MRQLKDQANFESEFRGWDLININRVFVVRLHVQLGLILPPLTGVWWGLHKM